MNQQNTPHRCKCCICIIKNRKEKNTQFGILKKVSCSRWNRQTDRQTRTPTQWKGGEHLCVCVKLKTNCTFKFNTLKMNSSKNECVHTKATSTLHQPQFGWLSNIILTSPCGLPSSQILIAFNWFNFPTGCSYLFLWRTLEYYYRMMMLLLLYAIMKTVST